MVEATGLKMWRRRQLQWHHLHTIFHENPRIGSKVIRGKHRQTDRHAGDCTIQREIHTEFCLESLKGRHISEDVGVDEKIILKWILRK
jgi:hypothetical protein